MEKTGRSASAIAMDGCSATVVEILKAGEIKEFGAERHEFREGPGVVVAHINLYMESVQKHPAKIQLFPVIKDTGATGRRLNDHQAAAPQIAPVHSSQHLERTPGMQAANIIGCNEGTGMNIGQVYHVDGARHGSR